VVKKLQNLLVGQLGHFFASLQEVLALDGSIGCEGVASGTHPLLVHAASATLVGPIHSFGQVFARVLMERTSAQAFLIVLAQ